MNQNQNKYQNIRQVSQQEIQQQLQGLTQEELQKTQVLNLKDVEETARFEKITSKKPAIIIAVIGALCLTFGTTFQIAQSLSAKPKNNVVEKRQEKEEEKEDKNNLGCTLTHVNNSDGTDTMMNISYSFEDEKLVEVTKTFTVTVVPGSATGTSTFQKYVDGFKYYMAQVPGYSVVVTPNADNTQLTSVTTARLSEMDLSTFPENQQKLDKTSIDYPVYTEYSEVKKDMISKGYTCK